MTAYNHIAPPDVAAAVKATEPCPHAYCIAGVVERAPLPLQPGYRTTCKVCGGSGSVPSLVGGWLTLPFPVQPGDEVRMVEEQWRHPNEGDEGWRPLNGSLCASRADEHHERRQAHFATVTAGEVIPPEQSYGKWKGWAFVVASVVLHDPPKLTMPCPCCHEDPDEPQAGCRCESCKGGSVPLSVTDGQEVTA